MEKDDKTIDEQELRQEEQYFEKLFNEKYIDRTINENKEIIDFFTPEDRISILEDYLDTFSKEHTKDEWFENILQIGNEYGLSRNNKDYVENKHKGTIKQFTQLLRLVLTFKTNTPDLYLIQQVMPTKLIRNRIVSFIIGDLSRV